MLRKSKAFRVLSWCLVVIAAIPVAYILSLGPVLLLVGNFDRSQLLHFLKELGAETV